MNRAGMVLGAVLAAPLLGALPAEAQITYQTLQDPGTTTTGVTGIRGEEKPVETGVPQMQVEELKRRLDAGDDLFVLDVREPHEYQICNIGGYLIPLGDLPKRVSELDSSKEIVAHCRSGVRSGKAADLLRQAGFKKIHNLAGGILAWADRVDPKMPKY